MAISILLAADVTWLASLFLGTVFIISGLAKVARRAKFQDTLAAMELLPRGLVPGVALGLPVLETALGLWVGVGCWRALAGAVVAGLLLGFLAVLALYRWRGGTEIACGCFADFEHKTPTSALILRNVLLLIAAVPLLVVPDSAAARDPTGWLLAATVVVGVFLSWSLVNRLVGTVGLLWAERRLDGN
jgi:Methylamine utilisation protein MauE